MSEPVALDLDWDLINHLVLKDSYHALLTEQFTPELIIDPLALKVYEFQAKHRNEHGEIATASVIEDEFDEVAIEEPETAIGDLIERLRKRFIRNDGQKVIDKLAEATIENPLDVGKEMLSEGRRLIQITETRGESFGPDDHERALASYDQQVTQGMGPSLGFTAIDHHFHGQRGVTVLLAAPKTYKSWLSVNVADSEINNAAYPYLYSLELPAEDTLWRLKCMQADIPYWKYLHGSLDSDDFTRLEEIADLMADRGRFRVEKPRPGERRVPQLIEKALNAGADSIIIDQLQYVETARGPSLGELNKTGEYFGVLNDFRNYSDEIPIFIVHQFNRTVMGVDGMPEMQQAKGSSAIEEVASQALAAWATKDMRHSNLLNLGVIYSRHHTHAAWEIGVELTRGCSFTLNGMVNDREDDDE
jgi:hypothetical protein